MPMMDAMNDYNQAPLDAWANDFLKAEIALRDAMKKMADLVNSAAKFQKDVTLPPGYYGYVTKSWQTPLDSDAIDDRGRKWRAERDEKQVNHPYNFAKSMGMIGQVVGKLGEADSLLHDAHERALFELCNFRIIDEGPGKSLGDVT